MNNETSRREANQIAKQIKDSKIDDSAIKYLERRMDSLEARWRQFIEGVPVKPEQRVVDLSKVVDTNIPMLFGDKDPDVMDDLDTLHVVINKKYYDSRDVGWDSCQFDTSEDAWVSWGPHVSWYTGECPLPDGVEYEVILRGAAYSSESGTWGTHANRGLEITAFRITGLKDGWIYPWQKEVSDE